MILKLIKSSIILLFVISLSSYLIAGCGQCESDNLQENIQEFYLPQNGLKVIMKQEKSVPLIGLSVFYNVGAHDEPQNMKGITKLQAYLVEDSGNSASRNADGILQFEHLPAEDIKQKISELTRTSKIYSDRDVFSITHDFNKRYLRDILQIEADRMQYLEITDSSFALSKEKIKTDGDRYYTSMLQRPVRQLNHYTEEHPYLLDEWGRIEDIEALSLQEVLDFRKQYFNPNNTTIVIVGDFDFRKTVEMIAELFMGIENQSIVPVDPLFIINDQEHVVVHDSLATEEWSPGFGQLTMCNINIPSYRNSDMLILQHAMNLLLYDIALDGPYSRKYLDKLGIYSYSHAEPALGPSEARFIVVNAFKKKSHKSMKKNLKKMIQKLSEFGFSEDYINKYKKRKLISDYKRGYQYKKIAWDIGLAELVLGDYNHYNRSTKILERLDNDEIKRVVSQYLLNQDIHSIEMILGEKNWFLTPVGYFIANIAFKGFIQHYLKKTVLPSDRERMW